MAKTLTVDVSMNRVEGDLEVRAEVTDGVCTNAWCSGTTFRGFERILIGRAPMDGLVITPRICGICSTSHLTAAATALETFAGGSPPPAAVRLRNVTQMTEHVQSDVRHGVLMFAADFVNPRHRDQPLYPEAGRRYAAFEGETFVEVIRETKKVLELVAIVAGQWPHSTFMVPGGITSLPSAADVLQCRLLLDRFRRWYERRMLGCSIDRWLEVTSGGALRAWLDERAEHRDSEVGFLLRYGEAIGLDRIGAGPGAFLSYGALDLPEGTAVTGRRSGPRLVPAGVVVRGERGELDQAEVNEHVAYSWFAPYEGGRHPLDGVTDPHATGNEGKRYSWAKAPRYRDHPAETGPLAEMMVMGNPLFLDLVGTGGGNAMVRQLARLVRGAELLPAMATWLDEALHVPGPLYRPPGEIEHGRGMGLTQAARGALGHWVCVDEGVISRYQIITPTAWNASPRDSEGIPGPMESALSQTPVRDPDNPVELGHVVRSFDPCLVCTVHALSPRGRKLGRTAWGGGP